jgi:hypothetical protein
MGEFHRFSDAATPSSAQESDAARPKQGLAAITRWSTSNRQGKRLRRHRAHPGAGAAHSQVFLGFVGGLFFQARFLGKNFASVFFRIPMALSSASGLLAQLNEDSTDLKVDSHVTRASH